MTDGERVYAWFGTGQVADSLRLHLEWSPAAAGPAALVAKVTAASEVSRHAAIATRTAESLASDNPGFAPITATVAHSMGLVGQDPAHLAEAAAQHHDPWAKASAAEDLGVLHARQGDRDRAVRHLEEALGGYQLTGATADMARIRRRLRKLGVRRRHRTQSADRPVSGWQSLTDAERAASELVAQGLSNRQAANRMYISSHTVAFYMRQAFRKLNISSRVELTRIVMQQSQQPATVNPMQGIAPQPPFMATRRSLSSKSLLPGNSAVAR